MADLNLWTPTDDLAQDYITFKRIHEELETLFSQASGRPFDLYDVEHVFWHHSEAHRLRPMLLPTRLS